MLVREHTLIFDLFAILFMTEDMISVHKGSMYFGNNEQSLR